jgi:predicted nucleic acid-binding protein
VKIVLDSNILAAQVLTLDYSDLATQKLREWIEHDAELFIPSLGLYEVASLLRKAMAIQNLSLQQVNQALQNILALDIQTIEPTPELLRKSLDWAERIQQTVAYDSAFLAVAESIQAELWTADKRLAKATQSLDLNWVRCLLDI